MLYAACWKAMEEMAEVLGEDGGAYLEKRLRLTSSIRTYFWDAQKGAYIDSFTSGKRHVTRHANIFAVLFDIANEAERRQILANVIKNDAIPEITTPYFNFFELDMLCRIGELDAVLEKIRAYWGGMLDRGAVTFWEEFDPSAPEEEQYDMYGDRFGKSLCHAWSASPIYFLAKYFMGLKLTAPGGTSFLLEPHPEYFTGFECTLPVGKGSVSLKLKDGELAVEASVEGGTLRMDGKRIPLPAGETIRLSN
jgi:hypothetical protein